VRLIPLPGEHLRGGPAFGEAESQPPSAAGQAAGGGEQAQVF
jgi:hypothetical protein